MLTDHLVDNCSNDRFVFCSLNMYAGCLGFSIGFITSLAAKLRNAVLKLCVFSLLMNRCNGLGNSGSSSNKGNKGNMQSL